MTRDPLHGVTLERMVSHLHAEYGWEELARRVPVGCFQNQPSVTSSLKFLRKTPWAREQVEGEYLKLARREEANPVIAAYRRGEPVSTEGVSQTRLHAALAWLLRHAPLDAATVDGYVLPTLAAVQDVTFWPDGAGMPLLNLTVEHAHLGEGEGGPGAAGTGAVRVAAELLRRGANPNDPRYWPPLLHAVDVEGEAFRTRGKPPRTDLIDLLLAGGADPNLRDSRGRTALDIAQAHGLKAAVHKLRPASDDPPGS